MLLQKSSTNVVSENITGITLADPVFLFEFQNNTDRKKYFQIFDDVSVSGAARTRAREFNIEVVNSGSGANKIILGNVGFYNYVIYEQSSTTNLDPTLATNIVKRGQMRLIDDEATIYVEHEIEIEYTQHEQ